MTKNFKGYWNKVNKEYGDKAPIYDEWLKPYLEDFKDSNEEILELGSGTGADTRYLIEHGLKVLSTDFSDEALKAIKKNIPNSKVMKLDFTKKLPFKDGSYQFVIADLCLHYFDCSTTIDIMNEILRILKLGGRLLARVNSIEDVNFGALQGKEIGHHYYHVDGYNKRFFDKNDVYRFFDYVGPICNNGVTLETIYRYGKPKKVYCVDVARNEVLLSDGMFMEE